jgi:hypothetical protein
VLRKGKPVEKRGRKATGLRAKVAGLPYRAVGPLGPLGKGEEVSFKAVASCLADAGDAMFTTFESLRTVQTRGKLRLRAASDYDGIHSEALLTVSEATDGS